MDQYEEYFEEMSEGDVEVGHPEEVVGVVAPMPIEIPLEVQVAPPAYNPQSPLPSPPNPSLDLPSAPQGSPVGDSTSIIGFYSHDDIVELEQWAVDARATRRDPTSDVDEPDVSPKLKTFLRYTLGAQWEVKLIRESGEVQIEQLRAYMAGYNQLTSFNRWHWLRLFSAWTSQERREQLEVLADLGGFWVI